MHLSGTVDPAGSAGGPVLETNEDSDATYSVSWDTMPEVLEDAGVSWKVYNPVGTPYTPGFIEQHGLLISNAILPYFKQYSNPNSALYQKAFLPLYPNDFATDVAKGTLPAVSWLIPADGYDEHPPAPPALGEWYTSQVLRTLMSNPKVWAKTVVFHCYDENDGIFDHVAPPVAPAGTAGEYVTTSPLPATAQGVAGPVGLGYRVPMLVISPFSHGGHVVSEVADHTSQLRFLEARFGVKAPNISAWRRSHTGDLTSALHMGARRGGRAEAPEHRATTSRPTWPRWGARRPTSSRQRTTSRCIRFRSTNRCHGKKPGSGARWRDGARQARFLARRGAHRGDGAGGLVRHDGGGDDGRGGCSVLQ